MNLVNAGTVAFGVGDPLTQRDRKTGGARRSTVLSTAVGTSAFDDITVTGSGNWRRRPDQHHDRQPTTSVTARGTDLDLTTTSGATAAFGSAPAPESR